MTKPASPKKKATGAATPAGKSASGRRQYLPAAQRREHILATARQVFARAGLRGARTRELAQAAGINQATLFEHFKSKEDLFIAAVVQPLVATMEGARERAETYAAARSTDDLMPLLQIGMQQHLDSMIDMYPLLVQALFSDRELGEKLYRDHIAPLLDTRADIVREFIKPSMDPRLLQLASFGMFFAVAMDQSMTGNTPDRAEVARQLTELITFGSSSQGASASPD